MPAPTSPRSTSSSSLEALESRIAPAVLYGVDAAGKLVSFDSAKTAVFLTSKPVLGLGAGETVVGLDFRPATGALYAVTDTAAGAGHLYTIAPATGQATAVGGALEVALSGTTFDIDFNPALDQLRLVSDFGQNLRINPATGALIDGGSAAGTQPDPSLAFKTGDANVGKIPAVSGIAYTNSFPGSTTTQLFDLARGLGLLTQQDQENDGTLVTKGPLKVAASANAGFDLLPGSHVGVADLLVGGVDQLYSVDVTTGATHNLGKIGPAGTHLASLAALPSGLGIVGKTATFRDADGDLARVTFTKGLITPDIFSFSKPNVLGGVVLQKLNLTNAADGFSTAAIAFSAKASGLGGDGFVDVGRIDASHLHLASLVVKGDLGSFAVGDDVLTTPAIGALKVNSLGAYGAFTQGGAGDTSFVITGNAGSLVVTGDLTNQSGSTITVTGSVKTVLVAGGMDRTMSLGSVTSLVSFGNMLGGGLSVNGDVKKFVSGPVLVSGLFFGGAVGSVGIAGDLFTSTITVAGHANPTLAAQAVALGSLTVSGSVVTSPILVGYNQASTAVNPDVQVGSVTVGHAWVSSNLAVGIAGGPGGQFGDGNDVAITPPAVQGQPTPVAGGNPAILSRIAALTVKGAVSGSPGGTDSFGFVANQIGKATIGGVKQPLTAGLDTLVLASTRDVVIGEVA